MEAPFRRAFDAALNPLAARNALGIEEGGGGFITSVTAPLSVTGGNLTIDLSGYQPLDADLTAIAALTGTNTIYYRSAANTWAAVTIGANLTFTAGTLAASGGGGGNVSNSGTPVAGQVAEWVDATHIAGVSTYAKLASPTFTGDPKAPTPTAGDNDTSIATTAFVTSAVAAGGAANKFASILVTTKTSGSGNHTLNANCVAWEAWWVGGGGGGGGSGSGAGGGTQGGFSAFNGVNATGGSGGNTGASTGVGGVGGAGGTGTATWRMSGGAGGSAATAGSGAAYAAGGHGASSFFGGGGTGTMGANATAGLAYGSGGAGASSPASVAYGGGGGGGGEIVHLYNGAATGSTVIAYTVGAAGNQGAAGTGGFAGASGAGGFLIVKEYLK